MADCGYLAVDCGLISNYFVMIAHIFLKSNTIIQCIYLEG